MKRKNYEELEFTDDFMFCKILEKRTDLCKELLEIILGKKIKRVKVNKQKAIDITYTAKSIRFDVYKRTRTTQYMISKCKRMCRRMLRNEAAIFRE